VGNDKPGVRFDEREIMFARIRLQPGRLEYQAYYAMHPDHESEDNQTRTKPGLLSPNSKFANPFQFAAVEGSFMLTESLREAVDGPVSTQKHSLPPDKMTDYVKALTRYYGALEVGITELAPYHVYSHIGRGTGTYGTPIPVEHRYAIAYTVEMDAGLVGTAPYPPTSMETGKEYVEAARVGVQLAGAIRGLGYPARAHIDGNYRVIAPLVARDAGLGEIGRMTILMTPRQGPRVRLGVVTTDLELIPDSRRPDAAIIDFCNICEKCAQACPSQSIPYGPREEIDGANRWKLNPDTCFRYWNIAGTDCARCMAVCPFSHPDTFSHNLVRWGIARSGFFRRAALWMDDLFYGRKPAPHPVPDWVDVPPFWKM
jgi:ferredoxin